MIDAEKITILNNDWITFIFLVILIILTIENFLFENRLLNTSSFFLKKKNYKLTLVELKKLNTDFKTKVATFTNLAVVLIPF